jgi:hypothetical protein
MKQLHVFDWLSSDWRVLEHTSTVHKRYERKVVGLQICGHGLHCFVNPSRLGDIHDQRMHAR